MNENEIYFLTFMMKKEELTFQEEPYSDSFKTHFDFCKCQWHRMNY